MRLFVYNSHMEIEQLFDESIAHAYIFERSDAPAVILVLEKKFGSKFGAHQNAVLYDVETFGIEDSRTVTQLGNLQTEGDVFVAIVARSINVEAQHALLKTFEEPKPGVHFLLFVENPAMLLPTLKSRCISISKNTEEKIKSKHPDFLTISLAERFAYTEKLAKNLKKDDPMAFRDAALEIFDVVIDQLSEKILVKEINGSGREQLERILELRNFLNDRGSSAKQLLETMSMQL